MSGGGWLLGIDFGTANTAAAVLVPGCEPDLVQFDSGGTEGAKTAMPSAVFRDEGGEILAGFLAEEAMFEEPDRTERTPKAKLRGGHVVETLGGESVPVIALVEAVLRTAYHTSREQMGGEPDGVALTCPVAWVEDGPQRRALNAAAHLAGIEVTTMISEPEAAAHHVAATGIPLAEGKSCAVYDLGGWTCDFAVMRREGNALRPLARMEAEIGGEAFDECLYLALLDELEAQRPEIAHRLREVRDNPLEAAADHEARYCQFYSAANVRRAKERLSKRPSCPVLLAPPADVNFELRRDRMEDLVRGDLERSTRLLATCIDRAFGENGDVAQELAQVHLVGGASQMRAVTSLVAEAVHLQPILADEPKGAIALGAVRALSRDVGKAGRASPPPRPRPPGDTGRLVAGERRVHLEGVLDAQRHGDTLLVLQIVDGAPRLRRFACADARVTADAELPAGHFERLACGASGVVALGPERAVLFDHELVTRGGRNEPLFARVGQGAAWIGYLGEGSQERSMLKRQVRPLRVRTFLLGIGQGGVADDVHLGEVVTERPPKGLGGLELRPEPPTWILSDAGGDAVEEVAVMVQRQRKSRLALAWSQDCIRIGRDGAAIREDEVKERPWTLAMLRRKDEWIRLAGREAATSAVAGACAGRAPAVVSIAGRALRRFVDERVDVALYAGTHDVFVLARNPADAARGGGWWELHRCEPLEAVRVHRGETPDAAWTGEDAGGTWFCEHGGDAGPYSRGVYVRADGAVTTIRFEEELRTLPLAQVGDDVYAVAHPPGGPHELVSYPWPG